MTGITVTGSGSVEAVPDIALVSLGVEAQAATAREALGTLAVLATAVAGALRSAGIADADLRTGQVSLGQRYDDRGMGATGYIAANSLAVTVRDLDRTGEILDAAVAAGATRVDGLSLMVARPEEAYAEALDLAVADARAKAARLAATAGLALGGLEALSEGAQGGGAPVMRVREMAMAKSVPVEAGATRIGATVTARFAVTAG